MRMSLVFYFCIGVGCFVNVTCVFGHGSLIRGQVLDSLSNDILVGATITLNGSQDITSSDRLGNFKFDDLLAGTYRIKVSYIGYASEELTVTLMHNQTVTVSVKLLSSTLRLQEIVVNGTESMTNLSKIDIALRPVKSSQDILRMVPGLFIAQHAGGGKAEQIFLRGFDIDHGTDINLDVDGLPVNMVSHAHGQGYSDLHFVIPEVIGIVDFNKGPYYANKGNFTTAGYAAFHTKNTLEQNSVKMEGGRFGTFRNVNAINIVNDVNGEWRNNAYVASEYFRTDGFFQNYQHFNRLNLMGKYVAYRNDREALAVGFSTFNSQWDASGQVPTRAVKNGVISRFGSIDPTEGGETSRTNAWVRYLNTRENGGVFENQLYFSTYDFNLVSNFTFFLNDPINGDQITQQESRNIYGYKGSYSHEMALGNKRLMNEVGVGLRYDDVKDIHLYHTKSRKQFVNDVARGDIQETNLYAFLNETVLLNSNVSVNAAVRFDHFTFNYVDALTPEYKRQSISKPLASPKVSINYRASKNVTLYAKSGIGFHSNDTRVVVAQQGKTILPKAYGIDLGANIKVGDRLLINTALWTLDLDQEFVYVGDEGVVEPSGKTHRQGLDLSLRYQAAPWLYIDTDLNIADPKAKGTPVGENYVPLAATFTSIGGVSCKLKNGFNASVRYRYLGDRPANEDNSVVARGYFLLDAVLKYTRKSYELTFSAENLLDVDWNEAQFDTESRLQNEADPVSEIHFTPGTPFYFKTGIAFFF